MAIEPILDHLIFYAQHHTCEAQKNIVLNTNTYNQNPIQPWDTLTFDLLLQKNNQIHTLQQDSIWWKYRKYDNNGTLIHSLTYKQTQNLNDNNQADSIAAFKVMNNDSLIISSKNEQLGGANILSIWDLSENDIVSRNTSNHFIQNFYDLSNNNTLAVANNRMVVYNANWQVEEELISSENIHSVTIRNTQVFYATENKVFRLNNALETQEERSFSTLAHSKLKNFNNQIYISGINQIGNTILLLWGDQALASISNLDLPLESLNDFYIGNDALIYFGNSLQKQAAYVLIPFGDGDLTVNYPDIAISEIKITNKSELQILNDGSTLGYEFDYEIKVKNNGNVPIHRFAVAIDVDNENPNCEDPFYETFLDIELAPGEEKWFVGNESAVEKSGGEFIDNCFELKAPNGELENELSSNKICDNFGPVFTNNIQEDFAEIYPNPFQYEFIVEIPKAGFKLELYNLGSQLLHQQKLNDGQNQIFIEDLPSGFYLLKIYDTKNMYSTKIIKK